MLVQRFRQCHHIKPTLAQSFVFAELSELWTVRSTVYAKPRWKISDRPIFEPKLPIGAGCLVVFKAVAIDRNTPVNSAFMRVRDREMISQSVLPTHHASIFRAKGTRVVKMAVIIEAGASFSKWEKWIRRWKTKLNLIGCYSPCQQHILMHCWQGHPVNYA